RYVPGGNSTVPPAGAAAIARLIAGESTVDPSPLAPKSRTLSGSAAHTDGASASAPPAPRTRTATTPRNLRMQTSTPVDALGVKPGVPPRRKSALAGQAVDAGQLLVAQLEAEQVEVLRDPLPPAGLGDHRDPVLDVPAQHHLRHRHP